MNAPIPRLSEGQVRHILEVMASTRFAVVGDFCLDVYLAIDPSAAEVSVETGLWTQPVAEQRYCLGGAGNVAANLKALGAAGVECFGVTGADPMGREMRRLMENWGLGTEGLLVQEGRWDTHTYTKLIVQDQEQPRLDFGNFNELHPDTATALLERLDALLPKLDLLIINQQVLRGIHTPSFRRELGLLAARSGAPPCILDSRNFCDEFGAVYRKINDREGALLCGGRHSPERTIAEREARDIARRLLRRWHKPLFLTRGERGCLVAEADGSLQALPGLLILGRTDPVGAGDSMLAGIGAALAAGESPVTAALFGTLAAGVTVQKLFQTGTASPEEILALSVEHGYRYHPELAALAQRAHFHRDTDIEIVTPVPRGLRPACAVFDHDGTISTLRQGWEEVMEPMMVRSILGAHERDVDEAVYRRVVEQVRDYIQRTTGVQTLAQMKGLVEMVRQFGYVPAEDVLDEHGYKALYNRELMIRVEERLARLERGELAQEDFTLKGAAAFLQHLHARGVPLYLASGTDQADVEREALLLGYAGLFEGRIHGAVGDLRHEPKRRVLEAILGRIGRQETTPQDRNDGQAPGAGAAGGRSLAPRELSSFVVFGDGPVEIQQARRHGGLAVGVASHELRRFGPNPDKRRRLIEAGAQLVIPDFSQPQPLLALLGFRRL